MTGLHVNAHQIAEEWERQPGASPCADLEPDPYIAPYACSRPYEHLGLHAATVPAEDEQDPVSLIAAVWE
jgi:hypothetical protein